MNLQDFMFPVTERQVAVNDLHHNGARWKDNQTFLASTYKAIVREDTNEVISIVRDTYQLVRNEELEEPIGGIHVMGNPIFRQKHETLLLRAIIELSGELVKELLKLLLKDKIPPQPEQKHETNTEAAN